MGECYALQASTRNTHPLANVRGSVSARARGRLFALPAGGGFLAGLELSFAAGLAELCVGGCGRGD